MAILRIKLVESLSKDRYLREAIINNKSIDQNIIIENDEDQELAVKDIISDGENIEFISAVFDLLLEKNIVKEEHRSAIQGSIIAYKSLDPAINPVIQVYNNFKGKISGDQLYDFKEAFEKQEPSANVIKDYFIPKTKILNSSDLEYLITLVIHISDRYTAKQYSDNYGNSPSIENNLLTKSGVFKQTDLIKKSMNSFTTKESNKDKIDLEDWFENNQIEAKDQRDFILKLISNQKIQKPNNFNADKFEEYIKNLYLPDNNKIRNTLILKVKLPKDSTKNDLKTLESIINQLQNLITKSLSSAIGFSINDLLEKNGAKNFSQKIKLLQNLVDKFNGKPSDKISAKYKLIQLKNKQNEKLANQLLSMQIPDDDIDSLAEAVEKFLKTALNQNYLYTTIAEAMALSGKQLAEGHKFLSHYLLNMKSDARNNYLDRFEKVWNNKNLQNQLLNARITKTANGFAWAKAITNFLDNIKL